MRVALSAEVLPPSADARGSELRGVAVDPDVDPALVACEVEHPVGDRVPEILVLEVVRANLNGLAVALKLPANRLEIPDPNSMRRTPDRTRGGASVAVWSRGRARM